jgi:hypothetical protein
MPGGKCFRKPGLDGNIAERKKKEQRENKSCLFSDNF